ncbi:hypothetical protein M440DRAFT_1392331 [Trichoderma longibrachiatum ATCC 18648]|uniref:Uncharacterized protein n=1 Tax=Trichoderma longibrachiatum ATCC 18648 TaxID=983965 RepID=A0A2T4C2N5_TRILO|nr:hypothetical protein M440DRAFT_1392331 [Trichoderma longibrachiatum ATCC 18648]
MGFGCGLQLEIGVGVGVFLVRLVDPIPSGRSAPQAPFHVSACFGDRVAKRRDAKKGTGSLGNFGNYLFSIVSESELVVGHEDLAKDPVDRGNATSIRTIRAVGSVWLQRLEALGGSTVSHRLVSVIARREQPQSSFGQWLLLGLIDMIMDPILG